MHQLLGRKQPPPLFVPITENTSALDVGQQPYLGPEKKRNVIWFSSIIGNEEEGRRIVHNGPNYFESRTLINLGD